MDNENMQNVQNEQYRQYEEDFNLCKRCGKRTIDRSENKDSILCAECRKELIKLKIPPVFFAVGGAVIIMIVLTLAFSLGGLKNFGSYSSAGSLADDGYVITAMDNLVNVLDESDETKKTAIELADIAMEYSYYDYAAYAIDNFLVGEEVSDSEYDRITGYVDALDIYYDTCDLGDQIAQDTIGQAQTEDEYYAAMEEYIREVSGYIGDSSYDQALLYYYMGYMEADMEKRIEYLKKCVELDPCYFEAQSQIATYYRRQGDLKTARELLEDVYEVNKEDYSVLRSLATLELTEGNLEQGLDYALKSYEMYPEGDYVADTYIVALAANGRLEEAEELVSELEAEDYYFDEELYSFLDGNMTLEEYYIGE